MSNRLCGHCHTCGGRLRSVLDGEEWCDRCKAYRRYPSHGWGIGPTSDKDTECPKIEDTIPIYPDWETAQAALDRGEEVRIEIQPFKIDPALVQKALDLQAQERLNQWKGEQ